MKKRLLAALLAAVIAVGTMAGCGDKKTSGEVKNETGKESKSEKVFNVAISYMPTSLKPDTASDDYTSMVRPIYEPLFALTKEGIDYYLAENLDISEDGLTYTIKLNPKATWSDGQPVTADDVIFTKSYASLKRSTSYTSIDGAEVVYSKIDDKTLEIRLPKPYGTFATSLCRMILIPAHAFDNDPTKVDDSGYFNSPKMVTSGAYVVDQMNEDSLVYKRRDDYYRGKPDVETVVMKTVGTGSTKQVAFENGEISYMRITTAEELKKYEAEKDKYNIYSVSEARVNYLQINPNSPKQLSADARKALFLAIDGQEIVDIAYGDDKLATPANSLMSSDITYHNAKLKGYKQDLETAKKLAKSSGLEDQTLTYIYNADRANMEAAATVIQQQLAAIGVKLDIKGLDSTTFFSQFFAASKGEDSSGWDLGTNGWDSERGKTGGQAYSYAKLQKAWGFSEEIANTVEAANAATSDEEAQRLYNEYQEKALEEYWEYPLTYTNFVMVSQKNVKGLDGNSVVPEFIDYLAISID